MGDRHRSDHDKRMQDAISRKSVPAEACPEQIDQAQQSLEVHQATEAAHQPAVQAAKCAPTQPAQCESEDGDGGDNDNRPAYKGVEH